MIPQHSPSEICDKIAQCYVIRTSLLQTRTYRGRNTKEHGTVEFRPSSHVEIPCCGVEPTAQGSEPPLDGVSHRYRHRQGDIVIR